MKLLRSVVSRKTWIHGLLTTTTSFVSFSTFFDPSNFFQRTLPSPGSLVVDAMSSSSSSSSNMNHPVYKVIDSHLHVWGTEKDTIQYPYQQEPPNQLKEMGSVEVGCEGLCHALGVDCPIGGHGQFPLVAGCRHAFGCAGSCHTAYTVTAI